MSKNAAESLALTRIRSLLDEESFVEIGKAVTARNTDFNLQEKAVSGDGVATGYGLINGKLVFVYSQDPSVFHGAVGEMHARKIVNVYKMAIRMGAPIIGLLDCAGFRLQEATDALEAFGSIYGQQIAGSGVIPQITAVLGKCGGGLAMIPGLADFTFMESGKGKVFVNSPNALKENEISKCDTSACGFQETETGLADGSGTEAEIFAQIRELVDMLPSSSEDDDSYEECADDLNRICPELENAADDPAVLLSQIADGFRFLELKKDYAPEMAVGFVRLNGATVGVIANRSKLYDTDGSVQMEFDGSLSAQGCQKAAEFVKFCDAFSLPVLSVTNVNGYSASVENEKLMAKAAASLVGALAEASVPKVNVITKEAYGSAYIAMNSKSVGADMVYAWPEAQIGMMDAKLAAEIMYAGSGNDVIAEKTKEYRALQSSADAAAKRGYVDCLVSPEDTRKYVIEAFEMLFSKRESRPEKKHNTIV